MKQICNNYIKEAFKLSRELMILADEGERNSEDDGCILLYSVIRDCAYRIKAEAEREKSAHQNDGRWQ
jgi:hypothetical protein